MREEGVIDATTEPTAEEVRRYDQKRKDKKVSNDEWKSKTDADARITKMKDGRTHLAYQAEHVVDLDSDLVLAAAIYPANQGDTPTLTDSVITAQVHREEAGVSTPIEEVVADKGYHAAETIATCDDLDVRTYIPEPRRPHEAVWKDKPEGHQRAVVNNHRRVQRDKSKKLQRRRSEVVERTCAHICDTGGADAVGCAGLWMCESDTRWRRPPTIWAASCADCSASANPRPCKAQEALPTLPIFSAPGGKHW